MFSARNRYNSIYSAVTTLPPTAFKMASIVNKKLSDSGSTANIGNINLGNVATDKNAIYFAILMNAQSSPDAEI